MLKEKLQNDLKTAMKEGNTQKRDVLRMLISVVNSAEIPGQGSTLIGRQILTDQEVANAIAKEAKRRRKAIELFKQGGREDLVKKEESEMKIVEIYLPAHVGA